MVSLLTTPSATFMNGINIYHIPGRWDEGRGLLIVYDRCVAADQLPYTKRVLEIDPKTREIVTEIPIRGDLEEIFFPAEKDKLIFLSTDDTKIYTLHLNPGWKNPPTITPSTNYITFYTDEIAQFNVNIKNGDTEQKATAYIWLITPDGDIFFVHYLGVTPDIAGIPLTLPPNIDINWQLFDFTIPEIMPAGLYNFNAVFINANGDRGPIGTWNFYVKKYNEILPNQTLTR